MQCLSRGGRHWGGDVGGVKYQHVIFPQQRSCVDNARQKHEIGDAAMADPDAE